MKWVAVFLIIVVAVMACGDVVESNPASSESLNTEIAELEKRIEAIEREIWGYSTYPFFESRIDKLETFVNYSDMPLIPRAR